MSKMNTYYRNKVGTLVSTDLKKEWDLMQDFINTMEEQL